MEFKKIQIDENTHIRYFSQDKYEIHVSASGPLGAWVYFFENGDLYGDLYGRLYVRRFMREIYALVYARGFI